MRAWISGFAFQIVEGQRKHGSPSKVCVLCLRRTLNPKPCGIKKFLVWGLGCGLFEAQVSFVASVGSVGGLGYRAYGSRTEV